MSDPDFEGAGCVIALAVMLAAWTIAIVLIAFWYFAA